MIEARALKAHGDYFSCANRACPSFETCWRAQKPARDLMQSHMSPTVPEDADRCGYFIGIAA